jgi:hypothetical protein
VKGRCEQATDDLTGRAPSHSRLPHTGPASITDGAFMEPSGRNRWQPVANGAAAKTAQIGEKRCRGLRPVAAGMPSGSTRRSSVQSSASASARTTATPQTQISSSCFTAGGVTRFRRAGARRSRKRLPGSPMSPESAGAFVSLAHAETQRSRTTASTRAGQPAMSALVQLGLWSPLSIALTRSAALLPIWSTARGHKTDTSETTRATSRDSSPVSRI